MRIIKNILIYTCLLVLLLYIGIRTSHFQKYLQEKINKPLIETSGVEICFQDFSCVFPCYIKFENLQIIDSKTKETQASIGSIWTIPSWIDIIFGKIAFVHTQINDLVLYSNTNETPKTAIDLEKLINSISLKDLLPERGIKIYSFACKTVSFTTNDKTAGNTVRSSLSIVLTGDFFWNPKKEKISSTVHFELIHSTLSPILGSLNIRAKRQQAKALVNFDLRKSQDFFLLQNLPFESAHIEATLLSENKALLQQLFQDIDQFPEKERIGPQVIKTEFSEIFHGDWTVYSTQHVHNGNFQSYTHGFKAAGTLASHEPWVVSFTTSSFKTELFLPVDFTAPLNSETKNQLATINSLQTIQEQEPFPFPIGGKLNAKISLIQKKTPLLLQIDLGSDDLSLQHLRFSSIHARLLASQSDLGWSGKTNFAARLIGIKSQQFRSEEEIKLSLPISLKSQFFTDLNTFCEFDKIKAKLAGFVCQGKIQCLLQNFVTRGRLAGSLSEVESFFPLVSKDLEAKAHFVCDLGNTLNLDEKPASLQNQTLDMKIEASVKGRNFYLDDVSFCVKSDNIFSSNPLHATVGFQKGRVNHVALKPSTLELQLGRQEHKQELLYQLRLLGITDTNSFAIQTHGSATCTDNKDKTDTKNNDLLSLCVESFLFSYGTHEAKSSSPISLTFDATKCQISPFELKFSNEGKITGEAQFAKDSTTASLVGNDIPVDFFQLLIPLEISGNISGEVKVFGNEAIPGFHMQIESEDITLSGHEKIPLAGFIQADLEKNVILIKSEIGGLGLENKIHMNCLLPIKFGAFPFLIKFPEKSELACTFSGKAQIAPFFAQFLDEDEIAEGIVDVDLKLSGLCEDPQLTGDVYFREGKLSLSQTGSMLSDVYVHAKAENKKLVIATLSGTDEKEGTFTGSGSLFFAGKDGLVLDIGMNLNNMELLYLDFLTLRTSGTTKLFGSVNNLSVSGKLIADDVQLNLLSSATQDLPKIDVKYALETESHTVQQNNFSLAIDLDIELPGTVRITGRGLESMWKGTLHVVGDASTLEIFGEVHVVKGVYSFNNKDFSIATGTIHFDGDIFTKSRMNIIAKIDLSQISAQIVIRGPLDSPRIILQSTPAMQQKEILSWLLFEKPLADISPAEGIQLAYAVLKMNNSSFMSVDLLEKIKKGLGLDRINISSTGDTTDGSANEVSFEVGKYISRGIFVRLSKDITSQANRIGIEANIAKEITVQAEVGDDSEGEILLYWKHNY